MMNVQILLAYFLINALSGCASFAMGRRMSCEPALIPERPLQIICIANDVGSGFCFDPYTNQHYERRVKNNVCLDSKDYTAQEEWIKAVKEAIK